ncbi:Uma2 family endonuclease [Rhodopila sp.]|uniref:Uma2 family endonuclease n=1 Tax=Rhodopila sp. TaxID=2480087 RepID=UPI003D0A5F8E
MSDPPLRSWTVDKFFDWQTRQTMPRQIRRPDAGVDCGRRNPSGLKAVLPRMVAEVLSPTTRDFDTFEKLSEYKQIDSLDYIMVIEPNAPALVVWSRAEDRSWDRRVMEGLGHAVDMAAIGVTLPLAEIYDGVEFPARPRLITLSFRGGADPNTDRPPSFIMRSTDL